MASAIACLLFTLCFIAIALFNPLFIWTNLSDYAAYTEKYSQIPKFIAQGAMLFFGPLYVVTLNSLYEYARAEQIALARLALIFGAIFATLASLHYFVKLSAVRLNLSKGHLEGIEQFIQSRPDAVITAIHMLEWTLFFGM